MTVAPRVQVFVASASALALDGVTKLWAEQALLCGVPQPVAGDAFRLTLGYNTGVAFGVFADGGRLLLLITGAIIVALTLWLIRTLRAGSYPSPVWPLGMILGGAIANFVDRLSDGRVTDFLDAGIGSSRWPAFNLADSAIVLGIGAILLTDALGNREPRTEQTGREQEA